MLAGIADDLDDVSALSRSTLVSRLSLWVPALVVVALSLLPVVYLFARAALAEPEAALELLTRPSTVALLGRSFGLALVVSVASVALSLVLALVTSASDMPLRRLLVVLTVAPLAVPCYVGASAYLAALSPRGPVGGVLVSLGLTPPSLYGFGGAAFVLTLFSFPFAFLPIRAALRRADASPFEAARVLGAGPVRAFFVGLWPALAPACLAGGTLVMLYALAELGAVALLRFDTFSRVIFLQLTSAFDRSSAAVVSLLLVASVVVVLLLAELLGPRAAPAPDRARPFAPRLRALVWPALAFALSLSLLTLVLPATAFVWWLRARGGELPAWLWRSLSVSVGAGLSAAVVCAALSLPLAFLLVRGQSRATRLLARVVDIGFALPGLVVALGLSTFALHALPSLYGRFPVLLLGYVVLFLALSLGSVRGVLARVPSSLEEAARVLGCSPRQTLLRVTLPLLVPGLVAGGALVALSVMKELSLTLLLIPAGESTLATRLWAYTDEAMYAEAALPGSLLVVVAALGLALVLRNEEAP